MSDEISRMVNELAALAVRKERLRVSTEILRRCNETENAGDFVHEMVEFATALAALKEVEP